MKKVILLVSSALLVIALGAQTSHPKSTGKSSSAGTSHPYYGGGQHTTSHGGTYQGGTGSSHKGGTYTNSRTNNTYGKHKLR